MRPHAMAVVEVAGDPELIARIVARTRIAMKAARQPPATPPHVFARGNATAAARTPARATSW